MASNLDYLDPTLRPLEDKLQAYLRAEKEYQAAEVDVTNLTHEPSPAPANFEQRSVSGSYPQKAEEAQGNLENLRNDLALLRQEIIQMLPVRDEWVKVNLGYGPSRVGAFTLNSAGNEPEYELRVVI